MPLIPILNDKPPSRPVMEKAFEIAEASLRLEGMKPGPIYYELKEKVLAREITAEQAIEIMTVTCPSDSPSEDDTYDLPQCDQDQRTRLEKMFCEADDSKRAEFERQMELARKFMQENRDALKKLAEGSYEQETK